MKQGLLLGAAGLIVASSILAEEPKLRNTLREHSDGVKSVAWSPDGRALASGGSDETVKLWDVGIGKCTATLKGPDVDWELWGITCVAYSPDGKTLAVGSWNTTIRLWHVASSKMTATLKEENGVDSLAWSPDGKILASVTDGAINLWAVAAVKKIGTLGESVNSVAWNPRGKTFASANFDGTVSIWEASTAAQVHVLEGHDLAVLTVAYGPDGKVLASGCHDGAIKLWDAATGRNTFNLDGHVDAAKVNTALQFLPAVCSLAFSPDGKILASGSRDKTIKLWDVASGKNLATLKGHSNYVESVAFSRDGKTLASASDDKTIRLWDVACVMAHPVSDSTRARGSPEQGCNQVTP